VAACAARAPNGRCGAPPAVPSSSRRSSRQ
jgi:hypothetical protein